MHLTDIETSDNLVSLFFARADALGDKPMLWAKRNGAWQATSWREAARQVCLIAGTLRRLGLGNGDRVMLVSENRPEWCLADLAIMAAGCITVPAYTTNTTSDHLHILRNTGARAVIVSTAKLAEPLLSAVRQVVGCKLMVSMEPLDCEQQDAFAVYAWDDFLTGDAAAERTEVDRRITTIGRNDLACIIHTSGTGGLPRGVRQHHGAILCNVDGCARIIVEDFGWDQEVFLSFLPLSHAYEHTGGQFLPIGLGAEIYYAESLEKLASNIEEVRPTIITVVPRLFEVLRTRIVKQVRQQGKLAGALMDRAVARESRKAQGRLRLADVAVEPVLEWMLRPKIRQRFGGRLKAFVSGGAPLHPEIGNFFQAMGLTVLQGYGQTEAGPVISCNRPSAGLKMNTVGPPLHGAEVRIAEDGEILIRGELVMHGYWNDEEASDSALANGWLHTGDIGYLDAQRRIVITDRKKDIIVNDKGDNISPQRIEGMLRFQPEIAQAMVAGDKRPYLVAVIVPDREWASEWASMNGAQDDLIHLSRIPEFEAAIRDAIDRVNTNLSVIERVRQFVFADEPFSIENKELTPTLKIRRHKLRERYGDRIDKLYRA